MIDVVLINPPYKFESKKLPRNKNRRSTACPMGLLYIAASLEKERFSVTIIDAFASGESVDEIIEVLTKETPKIIGITAVTYQLSGAVEVARRIKEEFGEGISVVLGGPHITTDPELINRFPFFDIGFIGEGEITFPKIVRRIINGEKIKGIIYGELPINLDELPLPARHLIDIKNYFNIDSINTTLESGKKYASILGTRGCPFNCLFCCSTAISRKVRQRSPEKIVDEMEQLANEYDNRFDFIDDTMTINRNHTIKLCEEIINRELNFEWWCRTRVSLVDDKLLKLMKRAGCKSIEFGIESGSERVRNEIVRKKATDEQIIKAIEMCKKYKIQTLGFFMIGFPTETINEIYQTVVFPKKSDVDMIGMHLSVCLPGSDLFKLAKEEGHLSLGVFDMYANNEISIDELKNKIIYIPSSITLDEMRRAQRRMYINFYFNPRFLLRHLKNNVNSLKVFKNDLHIALNLLKYGRNPGAQD